MSVLNLRRVTGPLDRRFAWISGALGLLATVAASVIANPGTANVVTGAVAAAAAIALIVLGFEMRDVPKPNHARNVSSWILAAGVLILVAVAAAVTDAIGPVVTSLLTGAASGSAIAATTIAWMELRGKSMKALLLLAIPATVVVAAAPFLFRAVFG